MILICVTTARLLGCSRSQAKLSTRELRKRRTSFILRVFGKKILVLLPFPKVAQGIVCPCPPIGGPPELKIYLINLACFNGGSDYGEGWMVKISVKRRHPQIMG